MSDYRIVDAVYGPPLHEPLPDSYSHRLPQELQRRVGPQLEELLSEPLVLPAGSLNSILGDPAPALTKELRIAVTDSNNFVRVATFNECETIRFTSLEFLWKQVPAIHSSAIYTSASSNNGEVSDIGRNSEVMNAQEPKEKYQTQTGNVVNAGVNSLHEASHETTKWQDRWPVLSGSLPFGSINNTNKQTNKSPPQKDATMNVASSSSTNNSFSSAPLSTSASSLFSNLSPQTLGKGEGGYCYIDLITRRGIPLSRRQQKNDKANHSHAGSCAGTNSLGKAGSRVDVNVPAKRPRSSSFSLPTAARKPFNASSTTGSNKSATAASVSPITASNNSEVSTKSVEKNLKNKTPTFVFSDGFGGYVDREEEILVAVLDFLGFRERVASSVVATAWHVVFYFAGACSAIHTDLPVFRDCSTRFLLGALEHSKKSLKVCGLVGRDDLLPSHFTQMVLPLSRVTVLDLSRCVSLTAECFSSMAKANSFPKLEVLYLKELPCLSDEVVTELANTFSKLSCLDISSCPKLTGKCIKEVGMALPMLRMFNISDLRNNFNGDDLYHLLNNAGCRGLHTISLRECSGISNLGQITIGGSGDSAPSTSTNNDVNTSFHNSSVLNRVNSSSGSIFDMACDLKYSSSAGSGMELCEIASFANRDGNNVIGLYPAPPTLSMLVNQPLTPLVCLNLSGCHSLSDSALEPLSSAKHLRYFNASYCHRLSDYTLTLLASFAFQLEHLDLTCLPLLTNLGVKSASGKLLKLRSLALGHCRHLTNDVMTEFIMHAPQLSELRLEYCKKIDARSFLKAIEPPVASSVEASTDMGDDVPTFPKLDLIDLRGCGGISSHIASAFGVGGGVSKLGVKDFSERRPGFLRRLPPKLPLPAVKQSSKHVAPNVSRHD